MLKVPRGYIREDDPKVAPIGHPAPPWLINYADLMTELVAFFVIMYALGAALNKDLQDAQQQIQQMMKQEKVAGDIKLTKDGLRITIDEGGQSEDGVPFFESGKAELTVNMKKMVNRLAPKLKELASKDMDILVEGHTDNVPIVSTQFSSNWELSTARATAVVRYMVDHTAFPPDKVGALGYGEFRPIAPNDVEENRRKNRRVVFFIKPPSVQTFKPAK